MGTFFSYRQSFRKVSGLDFLKFLNVFFLPVVRTRGRDGWFPVCVSVGLSYRVPMASKDEHIGGSAYAPHPLGFPRGSYDTSFLVK